MKLCRFVALVYAAIAGLISSVSLAKPMQLSTGGTGQALIFPYYTVNGGATSLMTIVNTTAQGKSVRVNFREARGGVIVASLNVYLSSRDVWTANLTQDSEGRARLSTRDGSCTAPKISPEQGLAFSSEGYDGDEVRGVARTREGYVEVIELASIPLRQEPDPAGLQLDISHVRAANVDPPGRVTPCLIASGMDYSPTASEVTAPSGGLRGTLSIIVPSALGTVAVVPTTAIENFWAPDALIANRRAPLSERIDLTSGGNGWAKISATLAREYVDRVDSATRGDAETAQFNPSSLLVRFDRSIDAVSALLMASSSHAEHAYTADQTAATTAIVTMPTKAHIGRGTTASPLFASWNAAQTNACDTFDEPRATFTDRESGASTSRPGGLLPPEVPPTLCFLANPITYGSFSDATLLAAPLQFSVNAYQNGGFPVPTVGGEGGWGSLRWAYSQRAEGRMLRAIEPREALIEEITATGATFKRVRVQLVGLPALGFVVQQYRLMSSQQTVAMNFAFAVPMTSRLTAIQLD
jgi:hypothetical protein